MKRLILTLLLIVPLTTLAAEDPALLAGRKAAKTLMDTLGPQLKGALESGGPAAAINVCGEVAQSITTNLKVDHPAVLNVTRVTDRARNPVNQAKGKDRKAIKQYSKSQSKDDRVVKQDDAVVYYKPLYMQEVCLKCHGGADQTSPEVTALLKEKYPKDKATGYKLNDFRGLIKVTLDPKKL